MEISQIIDHIFKNQTNINALVVITALTVLALFGTFKSKNSKIRHFAKQSPAILATVGIFFSFWGISIGLIGLDLNDIQNSIPKLLDGLKAKFLASLMGIFASILVRIAQSFTIEQEVEEINLDEKMVNLLTDIHKVLANNASNSPEALLQELKQAIGELPIEFRKQNVLLDSIKSSLAGEGDASVTTQLAKLRMDMRDALTVMDKRNTQRGDLLNKTLTSNFGDLTKKFDEFARVVAENNSKAFIEALEKAMRDFNNNITEQFGENFKQLNHAVGELLKWQENYKSHVETLTGNFEVALNSLSSIQTAFSDIQTRSQSFIEVSSELGIILQKLDVQLQDLNNYLKSMDQVADSAKQAFPIIEDNLTKLTMGFKKSTEQSLASINSTVESVSEDLVETTNRFKETSVKLRDSMENQRETLEKTSDEFKDVVSVTLKNLAKETKNSIENYQESLQETVTKQLDSIDSNIKQSNVIVNTTIKNASAEFEKAIKTQAESMNKTIAIAGDSFKTVIQNTAKEFEVMAETIAESVELQSKTLTSVSQDVKLAVDKTLRDLNEQSQRSIKEYENSLHNIIMSQFNTVKDSVNAASKDFNRLLAENTEKSTSVLVQQTQLLDTALQEELKKAIETMGKHLAALSNQFVQDYRPLTDKLREVVKLAEDLKMRGH